MPQYQLKIEGLTEMIAAFRAAPAKAVPELKNAITTSVNLIRPVMVKNAPIKSGKLRQNIYARVSGLKGSVGPDLATTKYAFWVHEGTRPYTIYPKTKSVLSWVKNGTRYFAKKVNHPGIKSNPFVKNTLTEVESPINQIFNTALQRIKESILK